MILTIFAVSCRSAPQAEGSYEDIPYDFAHPAAVYELSKDLKEISGISFLPDGQMACVQDEIGTVYFFSPNESRIIRKLEIMGKGDFEGIAVDQGNLFLLRSDGIIILVRDYMGKAEVKEFSTHLPEGCNAEGLFFDHASNALLIACKGSVGIEMYRKRAIYTFDLSSNALQDKPLIIIDLAALKDSLSSGFLWDLSVKIDELFISGTDFFSPSAIAIHPITNEFYILSGVSSLLLVLNPDGEPKRLMGLEQSLFLQPEGIAFAPNGDLYISNEGKGGNGNIVKMEFHDVQ